MATVEDKKLSDMLNEQEKFTTLADAVKRLGVLAEKFGMGKMQRDTESCRILEMRKKFVEAEIARLSRIEVQGQPEPEVEVPTAAENAHAEFENIALADKLEGSHAYILREHSISNVADLMRFFEGKDSRNAALQSLRNIGRATAGAILEALKGILPPEAKEEQTEGGPVDKAN